MNLDYFLFHLTTVVPEFPFFRPDGLGLSVLITSPGLLYAVRADWRDRRAWWLAGAALLVLIPSLLYYGGGWLQYGYRYFMDSVPFVIALCASAAAMRGRIGLGWRLLIVVRRDRDGHGGLLGPCHLTPMASIDAPEPRPRCLAWPPSSARSRSSAGASRSPHRPTGSARSFAIDYGIYMDAVERWLSTGRLVPGAPAATVRIRSSSGTSCTHRCSSTCSSRSGSSDRGCGG